MADYSDAYEGDCCNSISYNGKHAFTCKNFETLGDRMGRAYMEHAGNTLDHKGEKPAKKLATDAVKEKPEQWNTEWDDAYELGLKHGAERERVRLENAIEELRQRLYGV